MLAPLAGRGAGGHPGGFSYSSVGDHSREFLVFIPGRILGRAACPLPVGDANRGSDLQELEVLSSLHPIIRGHHGHSYSLPHEAFIHVACVQQPRWSLPTRKRNRLPWVCWAGEAGPACLGSHLPASPLPFLFLLPSHSFFPAPLPPLLPPISSTLPPFLPLPEPPRLLTGASRGTRGQAQTNISYFTSHVFILMGIREKPHRQLAHQGFISWALLFRVRSVGNLFKGNRK